MDDCVEATGSAWLSKELQPFKQGAESRIYRCVYFGRKAVIKERFAKNYRHPSLHITLTKERLKAELNALNKCKTIGINVPAVYFVNTDQNYFIMEEIYSAITARQFINYCKSQNNFEQLATDFGIELGRILAKLHFAGIMHGDLTTSNILLRNENPAMITLIDFGLAESNATVECKGVDLYVLERAITSTHSEAEFFFDSVMKGYKLFNKKQYDVVHKKLLEIQKRGRKREMLG
ncbi:unnamed protein product [Thelazia callipaeda]|uniref:non-specific serine/threonine protein kinase n=1 Tax=Thelazia callipaeda TaxID=103827 RepID=A0A0N5D3B5_THECL|nr:unnamed protein product [Thelazia callipaeda]